MQTIVYVATGHAVKVGDKVPGKRLGKYYAHVTKLGTNTVDLLYNGDVRDYTVALQVIDAVISGGVK